MKRAVLLLTAVLLLSPAAWGAAAKLPKAEVEQMAKAAEKAICNNRPGNCAAHQTMVVVKKGYALMMAEQEGAPDIMFVLFKKEGKVWKVLYYDLTSGSERVAELKAIPEDLFSEMWSDFNKIIYADE